MSKRPTRPLLKLFSIGALVTTGLVASIATSPPMVFRPRLRAEVDAQSLTLLPAHETTVVVLEASIETSAPLITGPYEDSTAFSVLVSRGDGEAQAAGRRVLVSLRRAGEPAPSLDAARAETLALDFGTVRLDPDSGGSASAVLFPECGVPCSRVERVELRVSALDAIAAPQVLSFSASAVAVYDLEEDATPPASDRVELRVVEVRTEGPPAPPRGDSSTEDAGVDLDGGAGDAS
jgi:hypothetical protein